jgi:hypothetical protein
MAHRLVISLQMSAGAGSSLAFEVTEEEADRAIGQLGDPAAVLRFDTSDTGGRHRSEMLIPVRAITHVGHDID